jgi:GR25 family glycosyltransferase involved in LPS biosynthesis/glycosyltransferase involved in cell wall biosynthesis
MIVRDAADFIEETLSLALPLVDTWMIVDTGSVDDTPAVIQNFFDTRGIPGVLVERHWTGFAHNRTEALQLAGQLADFALMLDADDLIIGIPQIRDAITEEHRPSYLVRFGPNVIYWRPAVFDLSYKWEFRGAVHEYAVCLDSDVQSGYITGDYHIVYQSLGGRSKDPKRFERDVEALEEELKKDPTNPRTVFYLGQSYRDAGVTDKAIFYYKMRIDMGGWDEERFVAALEVARILERSDAEIEEIVTAYESAHSIRPIRAEALYGLARFHRLGGRWIEGYSAAIRVMNTPAPSDMLFVESDMYTWRIADELALCTFYLNDYARSVEINDQLLWHPLLPLEERNRVLGNKSLSLIHMQNSLDKRKTEPFVNTDVVLFDDSPEVTLTITTCRRRELFESTIDSFLAMCTDTHLITRWICIDDGSSEIDRQVMQDRYPFFEFIMKPPSEAGHVHSMNRLLYEVRSGYWIHLEDDWTFVTQGPHVSRAIHILSDNESLVQVVLNKNYAENYEYNDLVGGELHKTKMGIPYRTHTYLPYGAPELAQLLNDNEGKKTNAHWPGFSLMPSVIHRERMVVGGAFNPGAGHFEREMAERLQIQNLSTAFFDDVIMFTTGKLRSDHSEDASQNAYALNNITQFRDFATTSIQIHPNWSDGSTISALWSRQFCGGRPWFGASLTIANEQADRQLVVNMPIDTHQSISTNTYLIHMEPNEGINGFGQWSDPDPTELAYFRSRRMAMNPFEWHLASSFDEMMTTSPLKTKNLSSVVSAKRWSTGHHLRLDFIHYLQDADIPIDIWGRGLDQEFTSHMGPLPELDKREGLFPYRYTLAVENNYESNYATEKIVDGILSECLTFYWGCPNLEEVIDEDAFIRLPLDDFAASAEIIRSALKNDEYEERLPAIRRAKREILNRHQIAPILGRVVAGQKFVEALPLHVINLDHRQDRLNTFMHNFANCAGDTFQNRITRFSAVDGSTLELTDELLHIFRGSELPLRANQTACALSHLALWHEIANGNSQSALIFEDDAVPDRDFLSRLTEVAGQLIERSWNGDVVFLDLLYFEDGKRPSPFHQSLSEIDVSKVMGGASAYMISRKGARNLLQIARDEGIAYGIDTFILMNLHRVSCFEATPSLTRSPVARLGDVVIDSDIQYSTTTL